MSRIGKQPIKLNEQVEAIISQGGKYGNILVKVKGPKGELELDLRKGVKVSLDKDTNNLLVERDNNEKQNLAFHGLYRSLLFNMVKGVETGYIKELEIHGVGYRAKIVGKNIEISLGFNNPAVFEIPEGVSVKIEADVNIQLSGADKQLVGETAAKIRRLKPPEPYKGKGIRYRGEHIRRKVGKANTK